MTFKAIVLGAGKGTRMRSDRVKVLHEAAGRPLVSWMLDIVRRAGAAEIVVVVGHQADEVAAILPDDVSTAHQAEQLGTGHATRIGFDALAPSADDVVLVIPGDMPLVRPETIRRLIDLQRERATAATLLTAQVDDPSGYGRILRKGDAVVGIVEDGDATPDQLAIHEVNTSVYAFAAGVVAPALASLRNHNAQGEYYLTDVIAALAEEGHTIAGHVADAIEGSGVNSHEHLAAASHELRRRINSAWMAEGVWMQDPASTYIGADVALAPDVRLYADVHLEGSTTVEAGAEIGPSVYLRDSRVGAGARVWYSVVRSADIGRHAEVGPYVSLRPGATLLERAKAGTFVEIKGSVVGEGSKVPHLSYIGDTTIGRGSNIGAGTITANYDGYRKHRTVIGDGVRIGSDTVLVAPIEVGDEAWTGAGAVITQDIAPGALAVTRSPQKEIPGYAARRKARADQERD